mmetsp:Transcript_32857/g.76753  ORF Transcript_32857/g.76753 Transcript_32857/m.76753 type:complete len:223 (-) Transcript_32857:58-726(-)
MRSSRKQGGLERRTGQQRMPCRTRWRNFNENVKTPVGRNTGLRRRTRSSVCSCKTTMALWQQNGGRRCSSKRGFVRKKQKSSGWPSRLPSSELRLCCATRSWATSAGMRRNGDFCRGTRVGSGTSAPMRSSVSWRRPGRVWPSLRPSPAHVLELPAASCETSWSSSCVPCAEIPRRRSCFSRASICAFAKGAGKDFDPIDARCARSLFRATSLASISDGKAM